MLSSNMLSGVVWTSKYKLEFHGDTMWATWLKLGYGWMNEVALS